VTGRQRAAVLLIFLLGFNAVLFLLAPLSSLYDTDSYYHLAVARAYGSEGLLRSFPWARFSALHDGFGDKELLFHLALVPFASLPDPAVGGRIALALLNAGVLAALAAILLPLAGGWGAALPLVLLAGSSAYTLRALRLRPEVLALLLLLLAIQAAVKRRHLRLALLAFLFTLSYTAFQALLLLMLLFVVADALAGRGWDGRLLLFPVAGAAAALLLHPHFPANLTVWRLQNVDYFRWKDALDVGPEIRPQSTMDFLILNAAWLVALAALWRSRRTSGGAAGDRRAADYWLIAALCFAGLYAAMMRFAVYAAPLAAVALCAAVRARGEELSAWTRLPWRGRLPLALVLGLCAASVLYTVRYLALNLALAGTFDEAQRKDWAALGGLLPPGAKVAAPWTDAQALVYWAPRAQYLNVLDPVFMAVPFPSIYAAQRAVFAGDEPDVPLAAGLLLDSDYLAYPRGGATERLSERLRGDPRVALLQDGRTHLLAALRPSANGSFLLDWRIAPEGSASPPSAEESESWPAYPRAAPERGRGLEGFVDLARLGAPSGCRHAVHAFTTDAESTVTYELAPWGPAALYADGRLLAALQGEPRAVLGQGVEVAAALAPGSHHLTVTTCASAGRAGFYLRELRRE